MKQVYYELKKIWTSASVLRIAFFMTLISCTLLVGELRKDQIWIPEYLNYHKLLDTMEKNELEAWVTKEEEKLENNLSEACYDAKKEAFECVKEEIGAILGYDAYRLEIQNRYEESNSFSVFSDSDSSRKEYVRKIAETYAKLQIHSPMRLGIYQGLRIFLEFYGGDLLLIVFLIYLVNVVFLQEEKNGRFKFLCTMARGNRLFAMKTAAVSISILLYMEANFLLGLLIVKMYDGLPSLTAAVQSIPEFYSVPYPWTIGEYLGFWFLLRAVAVLVLMALTIGLVRWSVSEMIPAVGIAVFTGICIWCRENLTGDGLQAAIRFWNPWNLLRGKDFIGTYERLFFSFGSINILWGIPFLFFMALLLLLLSGKIKRTERKRDINETKKMIIKTPQRLLFYEFKKLWIYQGGLFLFCFCIALQGMMIGQYRDYFSTEEYYYHWYIDQFGDRITENTEEKILQEEKKLYELQKELEAETDFGRAYKLQRKLERQDGFLKYKDRVSALQRGKKENRILKDAQYRLLFEKTEVSVMRVILLIASLAFLIPGFFQAEKETGMDVIQKTTVRGGGTLWCAKLGAFLFYGIFLVLICAYFTYYKVVHMYHLPVNVPWNCLEIYWTCNAAIPVRTVYWCGVAVQCMITAVLITGLSVWAGKIKNRYAMTAMILSVGVIPTILSERLPLKYLNWIHDAIFVFTNKSMSLWMILAAGTFCVLGMIKRETVR